MMRCIKLLVSTLLISITLVILINTASAQSAEATSPSAADSKLLFSDSFEKGTGNWSLDDGLVIDTVDGKNCLKMEGVYKYAKPNGDGWEDYTFKAKVKIIRGYLSFDFSKYYDEGPFGYTLQLSKNGELLTKYNGSVEGSTIDFQMVSLKDGWHTLEFNCYGGTISVKIDGKKVMSFTDTTPISGGSIEIASHPDSTAYLTDVEIWNSPAPETTLPQITAPVVGSSSKNATPSATTTVSTDSGKTTENVTGMPAIFWALAIVIGLIIIIVPVGLIGTKKMRRKTDQILQQVVHGEGEQLNNIMDYDVFISYSGKDKIIADAICHKLESQKIRCWIAPRDIPAGTKYAASILNAICYSKLMVMVYTTNSVSSPHVLREVESAVNKGIPIITFRMEDIPPTPELKYYIGPLHWLDALTSPLEEHLTKLVSTVEFLIRQDKQGK